MWFWASWEKNNKCKPFTCIPCSISVLIKNDKHSLFKLLRGHLRTAPYVLFFICSLCFFPYRKARWSPETVCDAAVWAAVVPGCSAGEHCSARSAETQDCVPPVAGGALPAPQHQGPEASLQRVLPQPHPAAELPGSHGAHFTRTSFRVHESSLKTLHRVVLGFYRPWTSLGFVRSWRNMTRSWIPLAGPTGGCLKWRWHLSTPARRSRSLLPRLRWPLVFAPEQPLTHQNSSNKQKTLKPVSFFCLFVLDPGDYRAGGGRSSESHEEVESSSSWGSSGQINQILFVSWF